MEWPAPTELISLSPQLVWLHYIYVEWPLALLFGKISYIHEPKLNGDLLYNIYKLRGPNNIYKHRCES